MSDEFGSVPVSAGTDQDLLGGQVEGAVYRSLLRQSGYRNLFFAMLTSSLGDWIGVLAILALAESILGPTRAAAFALSGVMVARVLPTLLLGPVAGVYVDRWDRKRTMIATDVGRGLVMAAIPFVTDVFQLVVATLLIEVMSTLFIPAKDASIPNLVRRSRLVHANQLSLMVTYGTLPLGGVLFALLAGAATLFFDVQFLTDRPAALAIWFNAATFFVSGLFITRIALPGNGRRGASATGAAGDTQNAWAELKEGLTFIRTHPFVRALIVGVMGAFLAAGLVLAVGKLFTTIVNAGDSGFGVLVAAVGVGLVIGLLAAGPASRRIEKERLFAPGIGVGGGALVVVALMPRLDAAVVPAFVMGLGAGLAFVTGYTMLQENSDDVIRGRTFAAFNTGVRLVLFASLVIGPLLVGLIGQESADGGGFVPWQFGGVRTVLVLGGLVALVGAVWSGSQIKQVLSRPPGLRLGAGDPPVRSDGFFLVLEGGEGSGKTTQLRLLHRAIEREGYEVVVTREPGGSAVAEQVRDLLLDPASDALSDHAEALLYAAARAQHVHEVIRPALAAGKVVLSDRFVDSSTVYQGEVRGLGSEEIVEVNRWATGGLVPDLVVLLDVDAEEGLERAGTAQPGAADDPDPLAGPDRLESEGVEFHKRVNEAFRRLAARDPDRHLVVDAGRPVEEVAGRIRDAALGRLRDAAGRGGPGDEERGTGEPGDEAQGAAGPGDEERGVGTSGDDTSVAEEES